MTSHDTTTERTILAAESTCGLGEIEILHPPGTFALTPSSRMGVEAIVRNQQRLAGTGLDWGSGVGCLTIIAARLAAVKHVIGLEISPANVKISRENAGRNGVETKTTFLLADSYQPLVPQDRPALEALRGRVQFILANPPSSEGDDGFEYRRVVLRGAREYLVNDGQVFLNVSYQYGPERVARLSREVPGFHYEGVLASTDWVPFDLGRPDLLHCLELYAQEERRGGAAYAFPKPGAPESATINAQAALAHYHKTGESPLTKWQTLLFLYKEP